MEKNEDDPTTSRKYYHGTNFGTTVDFYVPGFLVGGQGVAINQAGQQIPYDQATSMEQDHTLQLRTGAGYAAGQVAGIFSALLSKCFFSNDKINTFTLNSNQCQCTTKQNLTPELKYVSFADNVKPHGRGVSCFTSQKAAVELLVTESTSKHVNKNLKCLAANIGIDNSSSVTAAEAFIIGLFL